ncbi:hypothetical protein EDM68_03415 [Candidatus Uhrbacteria bacterium]|nr:MAG: hypothetical protein EDM68_03415 [Candidatus Uhrbacteria bacterium]
MRLPHEAIHEFRKIWKEEYGEDIPFEEARVVAERFLSGIRLMLTIKDDEKGPKTPTEQQDRTDLDEGANSSLSENG